MGLLSRIIGLFDRRRPAPDGSGLTTIPEAEYFRGDDAWIPVDSSWVHSLAYYGQGERGVLGVRFKDKKSGRVRVTCRYAGIPVEFWERFLDAPSKGKFVHQSGLYGWPYTLM
jgi:hypothetical protein